MLKYIVTGKLYLDSTSKRTVILCGSFDTIQEASAYLAGCSLEEPGEEYTLGVVDVQ
jgi:hypothetical protein